MSVTIQQEKCIGCGTCTTACPFGAIEANEGKAAINAVNCTACGACVRSCPEEAIVQKDANNVQREKVDAGMYKGVWVYLEQFEGNLRRVGLELLAPGRNLADELGEELAAVIIGHNVESLASKAIASGADRVYLVDDKEYATYNNDNYTLALTQMINEHKPNVLLLGATNDGRELGPRIASKMGTGLCADCTNLGIDPETKLVAWTRPAFGGNIMATIFCPDQRPQMGTVRGKVFKPAEPDETRTGEIVRACPEVSRTAIRTKLIEILKIGDNACNIEEAEIIVGCGRGIGKRENLKLAEELAQALGGVVGASRPIVDSEWISSLQQVGQTGKTVSPKIYIACGISGAIQHLAGMSSADIIIAINKDPDAPIFKIADYGIVGDVLEFLPILTDEVRKLKAN
ncbi:FAD-binding protein [Sporomusa acidovorans]|uniref:Caffeyl-CoA reductase-Etf complex subunit CarE n=1 Tax=Sporomusa acidovorans (strain ATCC 49682 / DSM 3132 / Mol) TaxID=1123286 RepID=A0ABZ3J056_SPOA4|nr:FAD-binding protein [Sporomusa acidovorans]OZC13376.1 acryloyl-CoA reductase electron transfer subunit beta [Sporomusa acidovorans DSM 3132]SDF53512.1 electron transfer flavoprotein alpha subunit apoprotein [Sporomusa acidovorans]